MENGPLRLYALKAGEGWTYNYGIDFTVKAGVRQVGVIGRFLTGMGGVLDECRPGPFPSSPRGIEHGYRIRSEADFRLLVVTSPAREDTESGWGGFVADFKTRGEPCGLQPVTM